VIDVRVVCLPRVPEFPFQQVAERVAGLANKSIPGIADPGLKSVKYPMMLERLSRRRTAP
jgi:hypothetical protein